MQSVFIKAGNQIFNREHICGVDYKDFSKGNWKILGYKTKLEVYTTDGKEVMFVNEQANLLWEMFSDASLDLTYIKAEDK